MAFSEDTLLLSQQESVKTSEEQEAKQTRLSAEQAAIVIPGIFNIVIVRTGLISPDSECMLFVCFLLCYMIIDNHYVSRYEINISETRRARFLPAQTAFPKSNKCTRHGV